MQHSCLNEESDRLIFGAQKVPQFLKTGVVVWGAGGHAKVVLDVLRLRQCDVLGLVDDTKAGRTTTSFCGFPVYHDLDEVPVAKKTNIFIALGDNAARHEKSGYAENRGFRLVSLFHPQAIIASDVQLGPGALVAAGAVINPGVIIGKNVIVNTSASIDHDCTIADGVHIGPGARLAGHVKVGHCAWIGIGATIIDKVTIGQRTLVGAGSVVIRNIPDDLVVAGVPARPIGGPAEKRRK
jgi:UDP-N-acetylbacillosamine N-acetyltransferase